MRQIYPWLLSICFVLCASRSLSQTPDFTVSTSNGCAGISIFFTNKSSGFSSAALYKFSFGDGITLPAFPKAPHTYNSGNVYTATLTVTDNGTAYTKSQQITVYKKPMVDFSADLSKVCAKKMVQFTASATPGDGTIARYSWDFGDGATLDTISAKVTHSFTNTRNATVGITVINSFGCNTSVVKSNIVTILPSPKVSFTPSRITLCSEQDSVTFTNKTTGGAPPTAYFWNFDDGTTSNAVNPSHSYGIKGRFGVRLIATSGEGCGDTSARTLITVASFRSAIVPPSLLCLNSKLTFTDSSNPVSSTPVWQLDNNVVAKSVHQFITVFSDTNAHTLRLINSYGACSDTAVRIVQARSAPLPSPFAITINGGCGVPANVTFADAGVGGIRWAWDVNNTDSARFNPTAFTKSTNHTYNAESTYYVKLRITDASGCTGDIRQPVTIKKNKLSIVSKEGVYGCDTLATTFTATSATPVTRMRWTFSDDNSTSVLDTAQHTFLTKGLYTASLRVRTINGCTDSAFLKIRIASAPANFDFKTPDTLICGNKTATFTVTGDSDKIVGNYYWNFGDLGSYTRMNGPVYSHQYLTDSAFTVSLIINNHGCADTLTKPKYVTVLPSFPKISSMVNDCGDRLKVTFKETSVKAKTFSWNFGDQSNVHTYTISNRDSSIVHYYPKTGAYKVVLTTANGSCISKDSIYAHTLQHQQPVLTTLQTSLCENDSLLTTIMGMEGSPFGYYSAIKDYRVKTIEYKDASAFTGAYSYPDLTWKNPFHVNVKGLNPGTREVRIITASRNFNCLDTTNYVSVQVNGPVAAFSISDTVLCLSDKLILTDTSKANGMSPIINWQWFFGDSTSQILTAGGSTTHQYVDPGNFYIKMVVTDKQNCTDTAFYTGNHVVVKGPKAAFAIDQNPILPNTPELFTNLTDSGYGGSNSYTWLFGDGTSVMSGHDSVYHTYKLYGDDTVALVAKNSLTGCSDTATSIVRVKNTNLSFTYTSMFIDPNNSCPPVMVKFKNTSVNFSIVSWSFGDGFTADNINTPSHTYYKPGIYKVIIYGYYNDNTFDSTWDYITIAGPLAKIHADVLSGCGSQQILFTAETQNSTSLIWDFGDGEVSPDSVVSHLYAKPDVYTPFVTVKSGSQCSFTYSLDTSIVIDSLSIKIKTDSVIQCHQQLATFTPQLYSVATNNGQHISYKWDFGTGSDFSKSDTASFTYTKPGVYTVSMLASSPYGCKDTGSVTISYTNKPQAAIQGPSEFCENTPVQFKAVKTNISDPLTYHWQFQSDTSALQNPAAQTFTAGNHSVQLTVDNNGCKDTVYQTVTVHQQPHAAILMSDTLVCLGTAITFTAKPANTTDTLSYFWNFGTGKDSATTKLTAFVYNHSGTYPVTLITTSKYGCAEQEKDTAIVLSSPTVSIQAPTDICIGSSATFIASSTVSATRYQWHFPGSTDTAQHPVPQIYYQPAINQTYLVGNIGNCYDTAYHTLTVHNYPAIDLTSQKTRICFGDSVQLTAHNGTFYTWITPEDTVRTTLAAMIVSPKLKTEYKVAATDKYGCKNLDSIFISVVMPQQIKADPIINACEGSRVNLAASGTDKFNWINGNNLNSSTIANPVTLDLAQHKIYTVIGSDKYGCFTDTAHIEVIVKNKPDVDAGHNIVSGAGTPVQLSATSTSNIVSWNWQPPAYLSCNNCAMPVSKLRQSTRFTVEATDAYGCKGSDTVLVTLTCEGSHISVPEVFSPNGDGKNDRLHVAAYGIKNITHFVIYERNGNKVWERNNVSPLDNEASWDGTYKNHELPNGTYVYMLQATCNAGEVYNLQGTITLVR